MLIYRGRVGMMRFLKLSALCLGLACAAGGAWAQSYPTKPITFFFPFSPGPGDAPLRPIFDKFRERTGQPIVFDYRPGANGVVGTMAMLRAPADGYSMSFMSASVPASLATVILPFTLDDIAFITQISSPDQVLAVSPAVPAKTVPEFLAWAKTRKQVNFAQVSAAAKLIVTIMGDRTGISFTDIPYKSGADATLAVVSGQADTIFLTLTDANTLSLARDGKVKLLAVASEKRAKDFPDLPALNEFLPGFAYFGWTGFIAPAKTPRPLIDQMFRELTASMQQPDVIQKVTAIGRTILVSNSPDEFTQLVRREADLYMRAAKLAGITRQPMQ
jgi:tripartite-type tricarboxylate transporter receptor subunit TctC